jgi:hypothetical protein
VGSLLLNAFLLICTLWPVPPREALSRATNALVRVFSKGPQGRWRAIPDHPGAQFLTDERRREIDRLESVGYLSGSRAVPESKGVTEYDREAAYNALNLYTSGHAPTAILMDMEGHELWAWNCAAERVWPDRDFEAQENVQNHRFWRRAHVFENGDILAIFEGIGLVKLDRDSNLLWSYEGRTHHDLEVQPDGRIYTLTRKARFDSNYSQQEPILEDFVCVLDPDGRELERVSVLESLENSSYLSILQRVEWGGDILHTNTIERLNGRLAHLAPCFAAGNVLLSILHLDTVCVLDVKAREVVWAMNSLWYQQHQSTVLDNLHMLIFDNQGNRGTSRVMEFDPLTAEVIWQYSGSLDRPLYSHTCGSCDRLPNGNTLITESDAGRAIEVLMDGTIVWEFLNPYRAGRRNELIATLFEMIRLDPEFPLDWLPTSSDRETD